MSGVYLIVVLSLVVAIALGFGAYNVGKNYWGASVRGMVSLLRPPCTVLWDFSWCFLVPFLSLL